MTKPPPKSGVIVPIKPQPPATVASNPFRAFDKLTEDADRVVRRYRQIDDLSGTVRNDAHGRTNDLADLFAKAKRQAALNEYDEQALARCEAGLQTFDAPENYEDGDTGGDLRPSVIAMRIAALLDGIPNAKPNNPEAYTSLLMAHVLGIDGLTLPALDAACRSIAESRERLPTIPLVMTALREQQALWDERLWAIRDLADTSLRALTKIDALELESKQAAKARVEQAKARAVEQARQKLEQSRRDVIDAEDAHCEASAALRDSAEAFAEAKRRVFECENELARAEAAVSNIAMGSDDGQT